MSVNVHSTFIWGPRVLGRGVQYSILTRVCDKSAHFTSMVLGLVLDFCQAQGWIDENQWLIHWSDGAKQYNSYSNLAFWAVHFMDKYRPAGFNIKIGVEDHFKGVNDRFFGQLDARLKEAALHRTINSIELAKDRCRYQS